MENNRKMSELIKEIPDYINDIFRGYLKIFINQQRAKEKIELITYDLEGVKGIKYDKQHNAYNKDLADNRYYKLSEELETARKDYKLYSAILKHLKGIYRDLEDGEIKDAIRQVYIDVT